MNDVIFITGHKNPDTDSVCSAIAYADFKNRTEGKVHIPLRLGELNTETQFALDYFGVKSPQLIETVKPQVADLNIDKVAPISPDISLKMAWTIMKKNNLKTLPVIDDENKMIGLASLSNITSAYMDIWDNNILSKSNTSLENILDTLSAKIIYSSNTSLNLKGKIVVAAMQPDSAEELIEEGDIVICGDRVDSQNIILNCLSSLMIITGNHLVSDEIIEKAKTTKCSIVVTPYDTFTTARLITQSVPVSYIMTKENLVYFRTNNFVDDIRQVMLKTRFRSYPVIDLENHIVGSLSRYHLISMNTKKVILVDHNEKTQSVHGLEDADILEIIDHHRIADIQTGLPIYFRNEPVGSTATIIASIFFENGIRPSKKIAGILCAAIISDTLMFRSPTSTNVDRVTLGKLSEIANLDPENFAKELFKASSSLEGKSVSDIFNQDFKVFTLDDLKIGISQVSSMNPEIFDPMKSDLLELMDAKSERENYDCLIFMITDILKAGSQFIVSGEKKNLVSKAFNLPLSNKSSMYVPGILSRKKQVIPPLTSAIFSHN